MNGFNATLDQGGIGYGRESSAAAAEMAVSTTYADLKALRDGGNLVPGTWYRITDYECTTSQGDTMSAEHQFDIIVLAIDGSHLSEKAYAAHHGSAVRNENDDNQSGEIEGEVEGSRSVDEDYFANCRLEAWELMYCLDNDTERFAWACDGTDKFYIEFVAKETVRLNRTAIIEDGTVWQFGEEGNAVYTAADPAVGDNFYQDSSLQTSAGEISAAVEIEGVEGKGVIYRMIDEFGNDCPYDFKNIMFKRFEITAVTDSQDNAINDYELEGQWGLPNPKVSVDSETSEWFYTFSSVNDGTVTDASLNLSYDIVADSDGSGAGNNVIKNLGEGMLYLNNIVFINTEGDLTCYGNSFGTDCQNITLGDWCTDNTFGNDCQGNTFGNICESNTFGNNCGGNTFGNGCGANTFGNNIQQFTVFEGVQYCEVTGGDNAANTRKNCQILNGTAGTSNSLLTITFTPNVSYAQVAGFNTSGTLKIWNPADLVN